MNIPVAVPGFGSPISGRHTPLLARVFRIATRGALNRVRFAGFLLAAGIASPGLALATANCTQPVQLYLNAQSVTVDPTKPVGAVLWSSSLPTAGTGSAVCDIDGTQVSGPNDWIAGYWTLPRVLYPPTASANVFESGVPGVGVRVSAPGSGWSGYWPGAMDQTSGFYDHFNGSFNILIELIKTGPIDAGTMSGTFAAIDLGRTATTPETHWALISWTGEFIVKPTKPTCTLDTPDVQVALDSSDVGAFSSVGSTGPEKDFNIELNCGGGNAGSTAGLRLALTDQYDTANTSTDLTIRNQSGDASGVKVQILRNGSPLVFGPAPTSPTAPNTWSVQTITPTTGIVNIPLKARMVRTGAIAAGQVNAVSLYTVIYQ